MDLILNKILENIQTNNSPVKTLILGRNQRDIIAETKKLTTKFDITTLNPTFKLTAELAETFKEINLI